MRVLFTNTFYYPNMMGGAEQRVKLLAEGLVKCGHDVAVYAGDAENDACSVETYNGVTVYRYNTGKFNLYRYSYQKEKVGKFEKITQKLLTYYNYISLKNFQEVCKEFKPDVIHSNTLYGIPCTIWKEAQNQGIPVLHTVRDTAIESPVQYGHPVNVIIKLLHKIYMRYYSSFANAVIAPSEYTLTNTLHIGAFKHAVVKRCIYNCVDIDILKIVSNIEERKHRTDSEIKFMYAGRLIELKGIRTMISAFNALADERTLLYICGAGEMEDYVKESGQKNSRIIYCGKLRNDELEEKYKECDVLIVPSEWPEPFGRVVIEGNKYGMPVICTNCGGIPEIINEMHGGEMYDAKDSKSLVKWMKFFSNRRVYRKYWENIINGIEIFDVRRQIEKYMNAYLTIADGGRKNANRK